MDTGYQDSECASELADRARQFMDEVVIPTGREKLLGGGEILDETLQMCGGNGIVRDFPISCFYENAHQFCLVDSAEKVYLCSLAREPFEDIDVIYIKYVAAS